MPSRTGSTIVSSSRRDAEGLLPSALASPTPTADKRIKRYNDALAIKRHNEAVLARRNRKPLPKQLRKEIPGLDVAALAAKYGSGDAQNKPQVRIGTFKVPVWQPGWDVVRFESAFARQKRWACERFLGMLDGEGWDVKRVEIKWGVYPYRDVLTGKDDPYQREVLIVAECGLRKDPEPVVIHLEREDVEPLILTR